MAVILDFNLVCTDQIKLEELFFYMKNSYNSSVEMIESIDNWMWENKQKIESVADVEEILLKNRIIIIHLTCNLFKDLGIYIEYTNNEYLYTLWINTEGYSYLDSDVVTLQNKNYYKRIYQEAIKLIVKIELSFKILAIGIETFFDLCENIFDTIQNSKNVTVWITKANLGVDDILGDYVKQPINELNIIVFEKRNYEFFQLE